MSVKDKSVTRRTRRPLWVVATACAGVVVWVAGMGVATNTASAQGAPVVASGVDGESVDVDTAMTGASCTEDQECFNSCLITETSNGAPCDLSALLPYGRTFAVEVVRVAAPTGRDCGPWVFAVVTVSVREPNSVTVVPGHTVYQSVCMPSGLSAPGSLPSMFRQAAYGL